MSSWRYSKRMRWSRPRSSHEGPCQLAGPLTGARLAYLGGSGSRVVLTLRGAR